MANIAVYPVADDAASIEGLCGNANDDSSDDLMLRNSTVRDPSWWEPVRFAASYRWVYVAQLITIVWNGFNVAVKEILTIRGALAVNLQKNA